MPPATVTVVNDDQRVVGREEANQLVAGQQPLQIVPLSSGQFAGIKRGEEDGADGWLVSWLDGACQWRLVQ